MVVDVTDLYREFGSERLPPGQTEVDRFPVLSKSGTPSVDTDAWTLAVEGAVSNPLELDFEDLRALQSERQRQDFHCVTGWSRLGVEFAGVPLPTVLSRSGVEQDAAHVRFRAADDYTTDLPLASVDRREVLLAWELDGEPLPPDHGGPVRVVTPHRYSYKGAKWVTGVEVLAEREPGYWEQRGYSETGNPWAEERYG